VRKADNLPPSCAVVTKAGKLNFLEASGPVQAVTGSLYLYLYITRVKRHQLKTFYKKLKSVKTGNGEANLSNYVKLTYLLIYSMMQSPS